jgi:hypothetical protein
MPRTVSRLDRGLRFMQSRGMNRGVMGGSRGWAWVFVAAWGLRRVRRSIGSEPVVVYRSEVKPGQTLEIGHLTDTYRKRGLRRR